MKINWISIVVSVVGAMIIGFLWYGAIFQSQWMAGNGITANGDVMMKNGVAIEHSMTPMIINTLVIVVYALIMTWLLNKLGISTLQSGAMVGVAIGLTHLLNVYVGNMFAQNPTSLSMVDGSYSLVLFTFIGAVVGAFKK